MAKKNKKSGKPSSSAPLKQAQTKSKKSSQKFLLLSGFMDKLLSRVCFIGIISLAFLMSFHTLVDTDTFWQLKSGEIIFNTRSVPDKDIFSFTVGGKEWIDSQWLFQLFMYISYRLCGYTGMVLLGAGLTAITWLLILFPLSSSKRYFWIYLLSLVSLLAVSSRLRLRPELFTFLFLALELFLLHLYRNGKRWALYPIPVLLLLWVNSHGLWPMGLFILTAVLVEQVLSLPGVGLQKFFKLSPIPAGNKAIMELTICLVVSALAVLVNPYGWKGIVFPLRLLWEISSPDKFFTDIHNSGYLIWAGYPGWRVYVDPRMELYGDNFIKHYSSLFDNWGAFLEEDRKYDFDLVFVSAYRMSSGFIQRLARSADWALIYVDGKNVVFLKNKSSFSELIQNYRMSIGDKLTTPLPEKLDGLWMFKERYNRGIHLLWLNYKKAAVYEFEEALNRYQRLNSGALFR